MNTVIKNARILTMDTQTGDISNGWLRIHGDRIEALGEGDFSGTADTVIDAEGGILLPGFINLHCHASMIPFRTMGDDCPDRLRRFLFPLENDAMSEKLVYLSAKYAIAEMLLSGTTTFVDMYYFEDAVAKACEEMGILGYLGETVLSQPSCDAPESEGGLQIAERLLQAFSANPWVRPVLAPHGTTTVSPQALQSCGELAERYHALLTLHVSEMDYELKHFAEMGHTPLSYLDSLGLVNEHLLAAHCIHLTEADIELLKQRGASVAHCIGSNMKAGKGIAPVKQLCDKGVPLGLGTDGPSSGNTLSMFDQLRLFAVAHKTANHDRSLFPAKEIVTLATAGGANALHAQNEFGRLVPGLRADLQLVSTKRINMFPSYNPYSTLVYSACSADVSMVMTAGKVRVKEGKLLGTDVDQLRGELEKEMQPFLKAAEKYGDMV